MAMVFTRLTAESMAALEEALTAARSADWYDGRRIKCDAVDRVCWVEFGHGSKNCSPAELMVLNGAWKEATTHEASTHDGDQNLQG